jgi:Conjugative transposon protein TcpC
MRREPDARELLGEPLDDPPGAARATVTITPRPLWRVRLGRELPRLLLMGAACAGLLASARYAIAPPRPAPAARAAPVTPPRDLAAEGFAQLFARRYLTWEANDPEAHQRALAQYTGASMEPGAGLQPPPQGEEQVQWTEVVQERVPAVGERVYTVAAQTDTAGLQYLSVSVQRTASGVLRLAGYPAFVGAPASEPADASAGLSDGGAGGGGRELDEPALSAVVERALRNYLADAGSELAADLTPSARVSLPAQPLGLETMQHVVRSTEGGDALTATVQATDAHGVHYTLAYDLDVAQVAGRWEIAAIQMDPDS